MLEGFSLASNKEITNRQGVVYLIRFSDGSFYIGSTGQTFRRRYGTIDLHDSHLIPSKAFQSKLSEQVSYEVHFHREVCTDKGHRIRLEDTLISSNIDSDNCLNLRTSENNFAARHQCTLVSPRGDVVEFESVNQATEFIGASNYSQVSQVLNGRMRSVCGWTLEGTDGPIGHACHHKPCEIVDPNGVLHRFNSQKEAKEAIGVASVHPLLFGDSTTLKGWHLPGVTRRKYMTTKLVSPDGELFTFPSRLAASKHIGCCNQLVSMLFNGKVKSAKGWTVQEDKPRLKVFAG